MLDEITGVGPTKRKALLAAFGSAQGVADADVDAVAAVKGIGPALAQRLKEALAVDDAGAAVDDDGNDDVDEAGDAQDGVDDIIDAEPDEPAATG